jgi:hypothetical protein
MPRVALACAVVLAATIGAARPAAADEREPPVGFALGTGVSLAIVPMLAGSVLYASNNDDSLRRTGVFVAMTGLALAPTVGHLIVREYKRAAIFAVLPIVAIVTNAIVFALDPQVTTYGSAESRVTFGVAMTAATLGATVGLADLFAARDRWRRRHPLAAGVAF